MKPTPNDDILDRLVGLLNLVVREQVGERLADSMERIRRLSVERRAGLPDAEARLINELQQLEPSELRSVIRWLSLYFDLANVAEDQQRIAVLQARDETARESGVGRGESIADAIWQLRQNGMDAGELQQWLDRLRIEPVFTAHPSEAKRRTTRQLLRRIRQLLPELGGTNSESIEAELLANLTVLWQTDSVRPDRPPVLSEVSRGVYFAKTLWDVVPQTYRELRSALQAAYPHHHFEVPPLLSFGTWIGGDRDGHPFVTTEITRKTLARLRRAAFEEHLAVCRRMQNQIVMSHEQGASQQALNERVDEYCSQYSELRNRLAPVSHRETCRRFVRAMEFRLERTLASNHANEEADGSYRSFHEFRGDLERLRQSVLGNRGGRIVEQYLQPWIDLADTFGFHFAALDIRQNSAVHDRCLRELVALQSGRDTELSNADLAQFISGDDNPSRIDMEQLSPESREVFATFLLLADEYERWGAAPIGGYIISMTHSSTDVLAVLWLWRTAWIQHHDDEATLPVMPIIPLFETIDDLRSAADILDELLGSPAYQRYFVHSGQRHQTVMVGYSDSTKDGGYLTACWELHQAQQRMAAISQRHHAELTVFHGRGGSLGRGGGPAARAIRSLPQESVGGRLRVTEQGEVLSERYDDPTIAHRHLEQIINATLLVSAQPGRAPDHEWLTAMQQLSEDSFARYRDLVDHPGFLHYFDQATPISEIETLPIGSRPARRNARKSLSDLRAIPWTFAWTQSRHVLPAWFGLGTAVRNFVDSRDARWTILHAMYAEWPMFRALIDNAELALAKADMEIARHYAALAGNPDAEAVWQPLSAEFERSRGAILMIKGTGELLADIDWLRNSVRNRNPYVDPLNLAQIHLLQQLRSDASDSELRDLMRLSIQGVAAGLRTTG